MGNVNVGDSSKTASQTDTCNNESIKFGLKSNFFEIPEDILFNFFPHIVVSFLDLAFRTSVFIFNLERVEDILPDIQGSVGVSESENHKCRIYTDNTFDIDSFFLDSMGVEGFVAGITDFTGPRLQI